MAEKIETYSFGAVDSRSNPLNLPRDRALLCRNWAPNAAGFLELRKGYEAVPMQPTFDTPIHSLVQYDLWNGQRYLLVGQGANINRIAVPSATGDPTLSNNLLINGNFQSGEATNNGWSRFTRGANAATYKLEGSYSVGGITYTSEHVIGGAATECGIFQVVDVVPGQTYSYAVLVFVSVGAIDVWLADGSMSTQLNADTITAPSGSVPQFYSGQNSPQSHATGERNSGLNRWELKRGTFTVPAGVRQVMFLVNSTAASNYFVQGAMLWKGSTWQDYRESDRIGYLPSTGKNLLLASEDFADAAWRHQGNPATVESNVAIAPDGTKTADRINVSATTSGQTSDLNQLVIGNPPNAGRSFTWSIWLRADVATTIKLLFADGLPLTQVPIQTIVSITTEWQRFSVTGTFTTAAGIQTAVYLRNDGGSPAKSFYAWGAQFEYGTVATAYVPNTGFAKWDVFFAANQVHIGNGSQLVYFDGRKLRKNGIRSLTPGEVSAINVAMTGTTGWPISTVANGQPGYQLYCSLYNPTTGAIGNRVKIGNRLKPVSTPTKFSITGLPNLVNEDQELVKLIGITADGDDVPNAICDSAFNWQYALNTDTTALIGTGLSDPSAELPSRNGTPPPMNKFCRVGDRVLGCGPQSPFVYVSGSEQDLNNSTFIGRPEQAWAPSDVLTFPTREVPTCIQKLDSAIVFSGRNVDMISDLGGYFDWQETVPIGCVGQRAYVSTVHGKFWITGEKQLATITSDGPKPISEEYQRALLRKIGDQYLADVEVVHYIDPDESRDELVINCVDKDGNAFHVIHDFTLRDERSPYGQGREIVYGGILAQPHTLAQVKDENGKSWIYAGAADGRIYRLNSGYTDNGEEIVGADLVTLVNGGPDKVSLSELEIYGDPGLKVSIKYDLSGTTDDFEQLQKVSRPTDPENYRAMYQVTGNSEVQMAYLRFQLDGHSADASNEISDPPNLPLEWYGRVYGSKGFLGTSRG